MVYPFVLALRKVILLNLTFQKAQCRPACTHNLQADMGRNPIRVGRLRAGKRKNLLLDRPLKYLIYYINCINPFFELSKTMEYVLDAEITTSAEYLMF